MREAPQPDSAGRPCAVARPRRLHGPGRLLLSRPLRVAALAVVSVLHAATAVQIYYVNDSSTTNDEWCTAPGDDANDGLTPATPKATVQAILDSYDLEPGDAVRIDTGTYDLTANITVGVEDAGSGEGQVTFEASPYGVTFDRGSTEDGSYAWEIAAPYVTLTTATGGKYPAVPQRWLRVTGAETGVRPTGAAVEAWITRCEATGNTKGISTGHSSPEPWIHLHNCLVHGNTGDGVHLWHVYLDMQNCTIHTGGAGLWLGDTNAYLDNNIVWADGPDATAVYLHASRSAVPASENNDLYLTNGAAAGYFEEVGRATLMDWRRITRTDATSFSADPLFVDPANGDYHLQSMTGSYHGGGWTADAKTSLCIDIGQGNAGDEPAPNATGLHAADLGTRNLGAYGGTEQASKTAVDRQVVLLEPLGGEIHVGTADLRWAWTGTDWQSGDTVKLEVCSDSGGTWGGVPGADAVPVEDGLFTWDITALPSLFTYRVRITANGFPTATDESTRNVRFGALAFYVNDSSTTNDAWCTAVGSDANDGLSPTTPKATMQSVLATYRLTGGDTVRIDTGTYNLAENIVVGDHQRGSAEAQLVFEASPYGVTINRGSTEADSYAWYVQAPYVTLTTATSSAQPDVAQRYMTITGALIAIRLPSDYAVHGIEIRKCELRGNPYGVGGGKDLASILVQNCVIWDTAELGISLSHTILTVRNCTIRAGKEGIRSSESRSLYLSDSVIWAEGPEAYAVVDWASQGSTNIMSSDFNVFHVTNGAKVGGTRYEGDRATLADWQAATGKDANSISADPLLAGPAIGDFHLKSQYGRWDPAAGRAAGAWVTDAITSPCVDTGDPAAEFAAEPDYNGGRINMGAYGNTAEASEGPHWTLAVQSTPIAGIAVTGTTPGTTDYAVKLAQGTGVTLAVPWQTGDHYFVRWRDPSGETLTEKTSCAFPLTADTTVVAEHSTTPAHYFVNDFSTSNDEWCTAAGHDSRDGISPATPKATVQAILDTYDLEPGDTVHIDTGTYDLAANITVEADDGGASGSPVTFEASPYAVTFDRGDTASGTAWNLEAADVALTTAVSTKHPDAAQSWMKVTGAATGIRMGAYNGIVERCDIRANRLTGVSISRDGAVIQNCLIRDTTDPDSGTGIYSWNETGHTTIRNCTIEANAKIGVHLRRTYGHLSNNIIVASSPGSYGIVVHGSDGKLSSSDYNDLYATNGAFIGEYENGDLPSLDDWQAITGKDANSISLYPQFVDAPAGDYHLKSTNASYHAGVWTSDDGDSPCLDAGLGDAGSEPNPNSTPLYAPDLGARNLGAYGGTELGSRTPTGRVLRLRAPIGAETFLGVAALRWMWAGTGWQVGDTVTLEYSTDSGDIWTPIPGATAVPVSDGTFAWDTQAIAPTPAARLRVTCEQQPTVAHGSPADFRVGPLILYVNDGSTTRDEWCTAVGDDANDGLSPATPKATVQDTLSAHDLDQGAVVRIDTGTYVLTSNITVSAADGGTAEFPVTFEASPYGVIIDRNDTASGTAWDLGAAYITLTAATGTRHPTVPQSWMKVTGAATGIRMGAYNGTVERCDIAGNRRRPLSLKMAPSTSAPTTTRSTR